MSGRRSIAGAEEGLGGGELVGADAGEAFAEEEEVVLGHADGLVHDADGADLVEVGGSGGFDAGVELGDHGEGAVFAERLYEGDRRGASDGDGEEGARVDDSVADGEDGEVFEFGLSGWRLRRA